MVKDPNRPKGRTSAYAFFVLSCRDELQSTPVNYSVFSKTCSERWAGLNASERKKFEDIAKADDARYKEEMKHYVPPKDTGRKGRKKKDPNAPKRLPSGLPTVKDPNRPKGRTSAYTFFILSCKEELKNNNQSTPVNYSVFFKTCSERWTALSASERKKFEDLAKADEARYEEEMKHYVPPKDTGKKNPSIPKQPTSAFFIFCSELRATVRSEYPHSSVSEIARKLVEMWSQLDEEGRAPFEKKAVLLRRMNEKAGPGQSTGSTENVQGESEDDEDKEENEDDLEDEEENDDDPEEEEEDEDDLEEEEEDDDDLEEEEEDDNDLEDEEGGVVNEDENIADIKD